MGDSAGGVEESLSESLPRETTEEAKLDTLPVELRSERERRENAAADDAVDVREDAGASADLG